MKKGVYFLVAALAFITSSQSAPAVSFQGLGDLPGADYYSQAFGISGDGRVVVGASQSVAPMAHASPATEAFYWTQATGLVGMGDFPSRYFGSQSKAASADGTVIVGYGKPEWSGYEAFRWTAQAGLVELGDLPSGSQYSEALDVSADGSVVVGVSMATLGAEAFIWTATTGMVGLGHLPGGDGSYYSSSARAVSADGTVVIGGDSSTGSQQPFIWTAAQGMRIIPGYGNDARDISGNGCVVVLDSYYGNYHKAYRWTETEGEMEIGYGRVYATNWDGSVIVGSNNNRAFLWDWEHGMRDLREVLEGLSCPGLGGWVLTTATGVSNDGSTIVGYGTNPAGQTEAWMVSLPAGNGSVPPHLAAWWKFNEASGTVAKDSAGTADGTLFNGPTRTQGVHVSAVALDGVDDYMEAVGYAGLTGSISRTCTAWIRTAASQEGTIVSWGNDQPGEKWIFRVNTDGTLGLGVRGGYRRTMRAVNDGQWHHVAVVLEDDGSPDVSEVQFYIDGILQADAYASSTQAIGTVSGQHVVIGALFHNGVLTSPFSGEIDDVRIYDIALDKNGIEEAAGIPLGAAFGDGSGTPQDPYQIWTSQELYYLSIHPELWDLHYILMADIDLTATGQLQPKRIGTDYENPFSGTFNGNSHVIKGLTITPDRDYAGLFGVLGDYSAEVVVKDLTLLDPRVTVTGDYDCIGVLAGRIQGGQILRCSILDAEVALAGSSGYYAGLLTGLTASTTVQDVHCTGRIQGAYAYTGGMIGYMLYTTVYDCRMEGSIAGGGTTGGFAGNVGRTTAVRRCSVRGSVRGTHSVGGFFGNIGMDEHSTYAEIQDCYSQAAVTGTQYVGGFAGYTSINTGGIRIQHCYSTGPVSGTVSIGGFCGYNYLLNNYLPTDYVGCFWNAQVNPGLGGISNTADPDVTGETTANMQMESTYTNAGWDFTGELENGQADTWAILGPASYPVFAPPPFPGRGTPDDPYRISTVGHLMLIARNEVFWSSCIQMVDEIDLNYEPLQVITRFSGVFDGNGHRIIRFGNKGQAREPRPLFLYIDGGVVKNLTLVDPYLKQAGESSYSLYSTLCDTMESNARIVNCHVINGYIETELGDQENPGPSASGLVANCGAYCEIVGSSYEGTVTAFQASGFVGGNLGTIRDCHARVAVQGGQDGNGFAAYNSGRISRCSTRGTVRSNYHSAGFAGHNDGYYDAQYPEHAFQGIITECSAFCRVESLLNVNSNACGFVMMNINAVIENAYAQGAVSGYWASGFAGLHTINQYGLSARCSNCYAAASLTGTQKRGLAVNVNGAAVVNCFWDTQVSGTSSSAGGSGRTTAQMQTQSTFTGWDFGGIWAMGTYPVLQWELSPLQAAVDAAADGDVIVAEPGVYRGRLFMRGKNVVLTSVDPVDPDVVASTVLDGGGLGSVVTFAGSEDARCVLEGLTISGGHTTVRGGGINGNGCGAAIRRCVIEGNTAQGKAGGGIWGIGGVIEHCVIRDNRAAYGGGIAVCSGTIRNCLIVRNRAELFGNALNNCGGLIENCTLVSDSDSLVCDNLISGCYGQVKNCILGSRERVFNSSTAQVTYSCGSGVAGEGNIEADPLFVDAAGGDWHLLPDSPCIDAGDPASDYQLEPEPNGGRINMGAYGNTPEAARGRDGLRPLGFVVVGKSRVGRTVYRYDLAVTVQNPNPFAMEDVQLRLVEADAAVLEVVDERVVIGSIGAGETLTSADTFTVVVDRSQLVADGRLGWELTYYAPGQAELTATAMVSGLAIIEVIAGDIDGDGEVNLADLAVLAQQWNEEPGEPSADIDASGDGFVGLEDLMVLAEHWLEGADE